jgi:long-chain acyl-CoA synthetase
VAAGYWGAPTAQGVGGEDGWYRTGDVGQIDQDGNLYFKGRKKEVLVTPAGMNVYPEDLEAALRKQPEIKDCVVVGVPRDGNAEPCAVLLLRHQISPEEVVNRANQRLAEFQRMHSWWVWPEDDFPRTSTQKPRRNLIQEVVLKQLGRRSRGEKPEASARNSLADMIAKVSRRPLRGLPEEASLAGELNLSSLDRVELLSALEDRYQLDLSETQLGADSTIADLERMLQGRFPQRVRYHYPEWVQHWPVTWIRLMVHYLLLRPAVFLLGWPRVDGRENLQQVRGPVLVICNHIDDVDVGFVLTALPAQLRHRLATAAGGEALEALRVAPDTRSWLGRMYDRTEWALGVSLMNLFPLPRAEGFRESFAYMGASVDRGYSILVFPEGRHTRDGKMLPFRPGIGLLAAKLGIPVVPMRIDGLFEVKQAGRRLAPPGKIRIKIGAPVLYSAPADSAWIAADLQNKVRQL